MQKSDEKKAHFVVLDIFKKLRKTISEVESDLPEDIRDDALRVFRSAIADKCTIQDAINKVT